MTNQKVTIVDKVVERETIIKGQLVTLRNRLNEQRIAFNQNHNDWVYLTNLIQTEKVLNELLDFLTPL
jgi:hypothetical protein